MDFLDRKTDVASRQAPQKANATRTGDGFPQNWDEVVAMTAQTFRFTPEETAVFAECKTARLIAALPHIAGCEDPERTALAHLAVYITGIRGGMEAFDHKPADNENILARLRLGMSFRGGDSLIIEHGMLILALVMINGYNRDRKKDEDEGYYNPLNDGAWDFDALSKNLTARIKEISNPAIERILPLDSATTTLWD